MRGKIAKMLRKQARQMTQELDERQLLGYVSKNPGEEKVMIARNNPKTTRAVYLALKKAYKAVKGRGARVQ